MKIIKISIVFVFVFQSLLTSGQGIKFEENLNWTQLKAKAKAENKYIFVDCYATWCGPCKYMDKNIFPVKIVGDFFNKNFISTRLQMDSTKNDDPIIKNMYAIAHTIMLQFHVASFPTYLFFSPDGQIVHELVGEIQPPDKFIERANEALDPDKQYFTLVDNYRSHLGDSVFLRKAIFAAWAKNDKKNAEIIGNAYLSVINNPLTKDNLFLIVKVTKSTKDKGFKVLMSNIKKSNAIMGQSWFAQYALSYVISDEVLDSLFNKDTFPIYWQKLAKSLTEKYPYLPDTLVNVVWKDFENRIRIKEIRQIYFDNAPAADWNKIEKIIKQKYIGFDASRLIADQKRRYFAFKKNIPAYEKAVLTYVNKYGSEGKEMNDIAFEIFQLSDDQPLLLAALGWSKKQVEKSPDDTDDIDTYANLLYKTGNRKEAIIWENKAVMISGGKNANKEPDGDLKITLVKMQNGEKTW